MPIHKKTIACALSSTAPLNPGPVTEDMVKETTVPTLTINGDKIILGDVTYDITSTENLRGGGEGSIIKYTATNNGVDVIIITKTALQDHPDLGQEAKLGRLLFRKGLPVAEVLGLSKDERVMALAYVGLTLDAQEYVHLSEPSGLSQALAMLKALRDLDLVHGDLKHGNICVSQTDKLVFKLVFIDLGMALLPEDLMAKPGTAGYSSAFSARGGMGGAEKCGVRASVDRMAVAAIYATDLLGVETTVFLDPSKTGDKIYKAEHAYIYMMGDRFTPEFEQTFAGPVLLDAGDPPLKRNIAADTVAEMLTKTATFLQDKYDWKKVETMPEHFTEHFLIMGLLADPQARYSLEEIEKVVELLLPGRSSPTGDSGNGNSPTSPA